MTGELSILNVSDGDTKLSFDPSRPDEVKRASGIVQDMLKRGYALLVEVGKDDRGPLYRRALDFDPETAEYIIAGAPETLEIPNVKAAPKTPEKGRKPKCETTRVSASEARATAVPRTAGG